MQGNLLNINEVSVIIGSSPKTIENWYRWKKLNPDNELVSLLPEYIQEGQRTTRFWNKEDIYKLLEFKAKIPHGRNGILGDITQKHWRNKQLKKKGKSNGHKRITKSSRAVCSK